MRGRWTFWALTLLTLAGTLGAGWWYAVRSRGRPLQPLGMTGLQAPQTAGAVAPAASPTPTPTRTPAPALVWTPAPTPTRWPAATPTREGAASESPPAFSWAAFPEQGLMVAAIREGLTTTLMAYHPQRLGWVRLVNQPVRAPALSPSGRWVALSLGQPEGWSLALLDLARGTWQTLATPGRYVTTPAWSPDEQWLVYAAWEEGEQRLSLWLRPAWELTAQPLRLPTAPGSAFGPAWSPQGRLIAYVAWTSDTLPQIWLTNLDRPDSPLQVSQAAEGVLSPPAWSPDGRYLAWCEQEQGVFRIRLWDVLAMREAAWSGAEGCWPRWRADGRGLWVLVPRPKTWYLSQVAFPEGTLVLPLVPLPGRATGYDAGYSALPRPLPPLMDQTARLTPTPALPPPPAPDPALDLVPVDGVEAPYPYLHREALPAFEALRQLLRSRLGWDPLARVASLYRPASLGHALPDEQDWLATGRGLALDPDLLREGQMVLVREDFPWATYWRVYLRPRAQDGSQGHPITQAIWDPEQGRYAPPPPGFWVDVTVLAEALGWQRLPALPVWPSYFPASRFNLLVYAPGLRWEDLAPWVLPQEPTPQPLEDSVP